MTPEDGVACATVQNARVLIETYRAYLLAANERRWEDLGSYVADRVIVNGVTIDRSTYVENLRRLGREYPDHVWELTDAIVEGNRFAVRLTTSSYGRTGFELAHYTWAVGRITEVWTIGT